ncbi:hypothetical protein R3P38DRAFT_2772050 [Favolaschia claudopus]|uniref:Uncharacterized protein n=1 Tax=Favolaschia claudopus TaxID=2862362 RepID=A0AAV9ZMY0_9AGAR
MALREHDAFELMDTQVRIKRASEPFIDIDKREVEPQSIRIRVGSKIESNETQLSVSEYGRLIRNRSTVNGFMEDSFSRPDEQAEEVVEEGRSTTQPSDGDPNDAEPIINAS